MFDKSIVEHSNSLYELIPILFQYFPYLGGLGRILARIRSTVVAESATFSPYLICCPLMYVQRCLLPT
jgi:hypothetical protein